MALLRTDEPVGSIIRLPTENIQSVNARSVDEASLSEPLRNLLYVDQSTLVPVSEQNGSISAPFFTITQAVAAMGDETTIILQSFDFSYEGPIVIPPTIGWCAIIALPSSLTTTVDSISAPSTSLYLEYLNVGDVVCSEMQGNAMCAFWGDITATFGVILNNGAFAAGTITAEWLITENALVYGSALTAVSNILAVDSTLPKTLTVADQCNVTNCKFSGPAGTWTFAGPPGELHLDANTNYHWKTGGQILVNAVKVITSDLVP